MRILKGSCLCGEVRYTVQDEFQRFFFCFCSQCRKINGSAHGANLFGQPHSLSWVSGQEKTIRYSHPTRSYTKVFCATCGTGLPFVTSNGQLLIVPAASLDDEPTKKADARIYCGEQTEWYQNGMASPERERFRE